jgi:hypothetical protein
MSPAGLLIIYGVFSWTLSTVKKSQAMIPQTWARRNSLHLGPLRLGAAAIARPAFAGFRFQPTGSQAASSPERVQFEDGMMWRVGGEGFVRRIRVDVEVGPDVLPGWFQGEVLPQHRNGLLDLDLGRS